MQRTRDPPTPRGMCEHLWIPHLSPVLQDERQTLKLIDKLPDAPKTHMTKIFNTMVEAKQNCEAIAFRGHRLLDQVGGAGCRVKTGGV